MPDEKKEPTMLDAVNAALEPSKPEATPEPEKEPEEKPEGEETPPAEKPEGEETPPAEKPEGEETPPGDKKPDEKPEGETPPAEKPEKEPKALDPVNDPIPPQVSERTRERITSLVSMVKEQAARITEGDGLFKAVGDTGVTPENFAQTLSFLRLFNSEKAEDRKQALQFLISESQALAQELGETVPGADPLEGHQDLVDAVASLSITPAHAAELARSRNSSKIQQTRQQNDARATQEFNAAVTSAKGDLNELGQTLAATDTLYKQKYDILLPKLREYVKTAHPSKWLGWFQKEYRATKVAPVTPPTPPPNPNQQPLRSNKQPAGDSKKQPGSMLEAVSAALEAK